MAEWLGSGLQHHLQRFESARHLRKKKNPQNIFLRIFYLPWNLLSPCKRNCFFYRSCLTTPHIRPTTCAPSPRHCRPPPLLTGRTTTRAGTILEGARSTQMRPLGVSTSRRRGCCSTRGRSRPRTSTPRATWTRTQPMGRWARSTGHPVGAPASQPPRALTCACTGGSPNSRSNTKTLSYPSLSAWAGATLTSH